MSRHAEHIPIPSLIDLPADAPAPPHLRRRALGKIVAEMKAGISDEPSGGRSAALALDRAFHQLVSLSIPGDSAGQVPDAALAGLALAVQKECLRIFKNELKDRKNAL